MLVVIALAVSIHASSVPRAIVNRALRETTAIWNAAGVPIEWHVDDAQDGQLRVTFGDEPGAAAKGELAIGWIEFLPNGEPNDEIHVSRANALALLCRAEHMRYRDLPQLATDEYIARAMGRALAHELGHWIFKSKVHDRRGLMATRRTPEELFGIERARFELSGAERGMLVAALREDRLSKRATTAAHSTVFDPYSKRLRSP